jgi:glyoxylase-like metal-dependent hydrolase (beta-lactamase superfamily II)
MLKIKRFTFNPFIENTYLIWDENTREASVIDPGCFNQNENNSLKSVIEKENLNLLYLVNTHCHIDHIFGNDFIKTTFDATLIAPKEDVFLLDLMMEQAKTFGVVLTPSPKPDKYISEKEELRLGKIKGKFLFTPGHSPGEYCLYFEDEKICFTGDVLFRENIGRSDLWGGDHNTLLNSIKTEIFTLPDDVTIFPGHGESSTVGYEKLNNPFLKEINYI